MVLVGWVIVGTVTLRRHNAERRQVVGQLDGHEVVVEFRIGRGAFTREKAGTLGRRKTRSSVVLRNRRSSPTRCP
ncbi:MAG: hypothetical protein M3326_06160 [Actinomycetota bacterium]|nr:hypothetical protein [Actinomycetota bacterium]